MATGIAIHDLLRDPVLERFKLRAAPLRDGHEVQGELADGPRFALRIPVRWDGRLIMIGSGGYGGTVSFELWPSAPHAAEAVRAGAVLVAQDSGHRQSDPGDATWASACPRTIIDFAYRGSHRALVAAREIVQAIYGELPARQYFIGCSAGGRLGLQHALRYPDDFDGIAVDSPTIDMITTNTFWHAWNAISATGPDGYAILTPEDLEVLHAAVLRKARAAGVESAGVVTDPRLVEFDARDLVPSGELSPAAAETANALYSGPRTVDGTALTPGGLPLGSELAWRGGVVPEPPDAPMSEATSLEYLYSRDYARHLTSLNGPVEVDRDSILFDRPTFEQLHELSGLMDPTDLDISAFVRRGGRLLVWQGWADTGSSPLATVDWVSGVHQQLGAAAESAVALYLIPGGRHCGGGEDQISIDYLTPLVKWVEQGERPGAIAVSAGGRASTAKPWSVELPARSTPWIGAARYRAGATVWPPHSLDHQGERP